MTKRILCILCIATLAFALNGCLKDAGQTEEIPEARVEESSEIPREEIPELQLEYNVDGMPHKVTALRGVCNWTFDNGTAVLTDSAHPLNSVEYMPEIKKNDQLESLKITFTLTPDSYTVRRWHESCIGETYEQYKYEQYEEITITDDTITLSHNDNGYIYEVYATWPQSYIYYSFYVK